MNDANNLSTKNKIIVVLNNVPDNIKMMVKNISSINTDDKIIMLFNNEVEKFFNLLRNINYTYSGNLEIEVYLKIFKDAIKTNFKIPVELFGSTVLMYADKIYSKNEQFFINLDIKDTTIKESNNFAFLRSTDFKNLWLRLSQSDKEIISNQLILATVYTHAYFEKLMYK